MVLRKNHGDFSGAATNVARGAVQTGATAMTKSCDAGQKMASGAVEQIVNTAEKVTGLDIDGDGDVGAKGKAKKSNELENTRRRYTQRRVTQRREEFTECGQICDFLTRITCSILLTKAAICFVATAIFIACFACAFSAGEDWDAVTSVYYVVVTISTVGYGDFSPSTPGMQVLAIFMIFLGVSFIFPLLATGVEFLSHEFTGLGRRAIGRMFPLTYVDVNGDGEVDCTFARPPPALSLALTLSHMRPCVCCVRQMPNRSTLASTTPRTCSRVSPSISWCS